MRVALDTNVLVRALVDDTTATAQCAAARAALVDADCVFVAQIVQVELVWVLSTAYGLRHAELVHVLQHLSAHDKIELEARDAFDAAFKRFSEHTRSDFADALLAAAAAQSNADVATPLLTFDQRFARMLGTTALTVA